jgi:hypothetical protein
VNKYLRNALWRGRMLCVAGCRHCDHATHEECVLVPMSAGPRLTHVSDLCCLLIHFVFPAVVTYCSTAWYLTRTLHYVRTLWMCATFSKWRRSYSSGVPSSCLSPIPTGQRRIWSSSNASVHKYGDRSCSHCASVVHVNRHFEWMQTFWYRWLVLWSVRFSKWLTYS